MVEVEVPPSLRQRLRDLDLPLLRFAAADLPDPTPHVSVSLRNGRLKATVAAMSYTSEPSWRLDVRSCRDSAAWSMTQALRRLTMLRAPGAAFGQPGELPSEAELGAATQVAIPIDNVPHTFSTWRLPDRWLATARLDVQDAVVELLGVGRDLPDDPALISVDPTAVSVSTR
ncbi:MAG TPA: hypothetical protein VFN80_11680 [Acidothermaceae bacterium]|nr:hypothetical protein [Acidothermaceae bacterium]